MDGVLRPFSPAAVTVRCACDAPDAKVQPRARIGPISTQEANLRLTDYRHDCTLEHEDVKLNCFADTIC